MLFGLTTGLKRKAITRLRFAQYDETEQSLLNVLRWKTSTKQHNLSLEDVAAEVVEAWRESQKDCEFTFLSDGDPIKSNYRTLKEVCEKLKIPYGRFIDGGFIAHNLRHNFGTRILRSPDIKTTRELFDAVTYLHTSSERLREAIRMNDKINYDEKLKEVFAGIKKTK